MDVERVTIESIECLGEVDDYVFDLSISNGEPYFFANDILVHNTDSVSKCSLITTTIGDITVEQLFDSGTIFWSEGEKEYSRNDDIKVRHYSSTTNETFSTYNYVYRHKVTKGKWKITTDEGYSVITTSDHAIMVLTPDSRGSDYSLSSKKPSEITDDDRVLILNEYDGGVVPTWVNRVEQLEDFDNEYVYDIGVNNLEPWFFANGILVHNSCYFSAWPVIKDDVESGKIEWNHDVCVQLYDHVAEVVNDRFPQIAKDNFNCPPENGAIIKAGRESVASVALFIKKKRYAAMIYDMEGVRYDNFDEATAKKKGVIFGHGKIKAMGLDLRRADTPKIVQKFLSGLLQELFTKEDAKAEIVAKVKAFKEHFASLPAWDKGTPRRVNKLTHYGKQLDAKGKVTMPGHVRAALNWNLLRGFNHDKVSDRITDGMKVVVCPLKNNEYGFDSIAYPTDILHIPQWFKDLPFDHDLMMATLVDKKVENLFGILEWGLGSETVTSNEFDNLFGE